jgi:hypothetical protein
VNGRLHFLLFPCYLCVAFKLSRFGNTDKLVRMGFLQNQKLRRKSNSVECVVSRRIDEERKMQYRSAHKATESLYLVNPNINTVLKNEYSFL